MLNIVVLPLVQAATVTSNDNNRLMDADTTIFARTSPSWEYWKTWQRNISASKKPLACLA